MTTRRERLVCVFALCAGCHGKELPSIKPFQYVDSYLIVPAGDHEYDVLVELTVPADYERVERGQSVGYKRLNRDPSIYVHGTRSRERDDYAPHPDQMFYCQDEDPLANRVLRAEPRGDGDLIICEEHYRSRDHELQATAVIRHWRWRDQQFQCSVAFPAKPYTELSSDEGRPSEARIADAIAICDSVSIQEMTEADLARFFPLPPELRSLPTAKRLWLYPRTR